jgi:hypothetical protein
MDVAATVLNLVVGPAVVLLLGWYGKGRFDTLERRLDRLETRIDDRIIVSRNGSSVSTAGSTR